MTLDDRVHAFELFFELLQSTGSRLQKEHEVEFFKQTEPELLEDWTYILETLAGKHPIGWTFKPAVGFSTGSDVSHTSTIKDLIRMCERTPDKSISCTTCVEREIGLIYGHFLAPIVNRTLRLGIGKSLLAKSDITPMLAKKYEGGRLNGEFVVTEKLDGNRCVAAFNKETQTWEFYSRSGKPMKVDFDMSTFDPYLIYDGEVMSVEQTELSDRRYKAFIDDTDFAYDTRSAQLQFNKTSGLINRDGKKSGLVYNIFDIVSPEPYHVRREYLYDLSTTADTRILPVLYCGGDKRVIDTILGCMTQMGAEGIMLNDATRGYEHKRSDALLKYKQVQFMDMMVVNLYGGSGKYEGLIGGLSCFIHTEDGREIHCDVGSGLSDQQRYQWAQDPLRIVGKIVQVGYHELTQSDENIGTNVYSLRFPRLIKVRTDKDTTSEY